ncbi:MAG: J domain-containing protein [Chitinophagaceae bacterium]
MIEAFPLDWPIGYKRTRQRIDSKFKQGMEAAQRFLRDEIKRLGATGLIISSNVPVRKDGGMYTDYMNKRLEDPGVAIFFRYNGKPVTMCCDQYNRVWENIYALGKGIEAIRGMERWGVSEFIERAFTGFTALPSSVPAERNIWDVLELAVKPVDSEMVKEAYRRLAKLRHPDISGGSHEAFQELTDAYNRALAFYK